MPGTYWNPLVANRVAGRHWIARRVARADGTYERVIQVVSTTDRYTGHLVWTVEMAEEGPGLGMTAQHYGTYPCSAREHAVSDAKLLARHYGLQARTATEASGWVWIRTDADAALEQPDPADSPMMPE